MDSEVPLREAAEALDQYELVNGARNYRRVFPDEMSAIVGFDVNNADLKRQGLTWIRVYDKHAYTFDGRRHFIWALANLISENAAERPKARASPYTAPADSALGEPAANQDTSGPETGGNGKSFLAVLDSYLERSPVGVEEERLKGYEYGRRLDYRSLGEGDLAAFFPGMDTGRLAKLVEEYCIYSEATEKGKLYDFGDRKTLLEVMQKANNRPIVTGQGNGCAEGEEKQGMGEAVQEPKEAIPETEENTNDVQVPDEVNQETIVEEGSGGKQPPFGETVKDELEPADGSDGVYVEVNLEEFLSIEGMPGALQAVEGELGKPEYRAEKAGKGYKIGLAGYQAFMELVYRIKDGHSPGTIVDGQIGIEEPTKRRENWSLSRSEIFEGLGIYSMSPSLIMRDLRDRAGIEMTGSKGEARYILEDPAKRVSLIEAALRRGYVKESDLEVVKKWFGIEGAEITKPEKPMEKKEIKAKNLPARARSYEPVQPEAKQQPARRYKDLEHCIKRARKGRLPSRAIEEGEELGDGSQDGGMASKLAQLIAGEQLIEKLLERASHGRKNPMETAYLWNLATEYRDHARILGRHRRALHKGAPGVPYLRWDRERGPRPGESLEYAAEMAARLSRGYKLGRELTGDPCLDKFLEVLMEENEMVGRELRDLVDGKDIFSEHEVVDEERVAI